MSELLELDIPIKAFYIFSEKDKGLVGDLEKHLKSLYLFTNVVWHCEQIEAQDKKCEIERHINEADVILLLLSSDLICSDYARETVFTLSIRRHEAGKACVIPVILRPVNWEITLLHELEPLPEGGEHVNNRRVWPTQDDAFQNIVRRLQDRIEKLIENRRQKILQWNLQDYRQKLSERVLFSDAFLEEIPLGNDVLNVLRTKYGLALEHTEQIDRQINSRQWIELQKRLQQYEQQLYYALEREYPPSPYTRIGLRKIQQSLELSDDDIRLIEERVVGTREEYRKSLRRYKQVFSDGIRKNQGVISEDVKNELRRIEKSTGIKREHIEVIEQESKEQEANRQYNEKRYKEIYSKLLTLIEEESIHGNDARTVLAYLQVKCLYLNDDETDQIEKQVAQEMINNTNANGSSVGFSTSAVSSI
ncbi:hypothetical protein [Leptolyngbya sp. FACHB-261]|uniref:hypothetical protein n=1 Tax=Leptolyngbya sp. FACHB-261 TaxID=2692806 RepID=UPI0016863461|nr:hypothetical protein [Leptolyngbya sp. FACHB-261]MBD2099719.1 hypothetical protein [Leptolyngbya sp. FACHB-261]